MNDFSLASLVAQMVKHLPAMLETSGSIPGSGRSPGEGNGNPLQYSCLENPMKRKAWWARVHGIAESDMTEQPILWARRCPLFSRKLVTGQRNLITHSHLGNLEKHLLGQCLHFP